MKQQNYRSLLYFIVTTIDITIAIQFYWNVQNYNSNKQRLINEVQISLDNGVEAYYSDLAKTDIFAFVSNGNTNYDSNSTDNPFWNHTKRDSSIKEIRKHLDEVGKKDNTHYLLTIATGADQAYINNTDLGKAHQYLDFINIMTYDYYTGGGQATGHHSNLFASASNPNGRSSARAVEEHVNAGIPIEKLVLGVPFYGRWWKGADADNNGLYQDSDGERGGYSFKEIEENYVNKNGFERLWDDSAKAPYLWNATEKQFVTYEDAKSLKLKVDFIKEKKMAGVMFWQLFGDSDTLLNTISENLK